MNRFDRIRHYYGVPAKRGGRVRIWTGEEGKIVAIQRARLTVRMDDDQRLSYLHPTYGVTYLTEGVVT